jgi:hypothetical protein
LVPDDESSIKLAMGFQGTISKSIAFDMYKLTIVLSAKKLART